MGHENITYTFGKLHRNQANNESKLQPIRIAVIIYHGNCKLLQSGYLSVCGDDFLEEFEKETQTYKTYKIT